MIPYVDISFTVFYESYHAPTLANGSVAELNHINGSLHLGELNLTETGSVTLPESLILCTRARPLLFMLLMLGTLWVGYTLYQFRRRWGALPVSHTHTHTLMGILKSDRRLFWHPHLSFFLAVRFCMWRWERFCPTVLCLSQCLSSLMWDHTSSTTLPVSHYMCSCCTHRYTNIYMCKHYSSSIQFSIWCLVIYIQNIWQVQYVSKKKKF